MKLGKKRLISLVAAGGLGAATLAVVAASAQASAPVKCTAGSKGAGTACVLIDNKTMADEVNSVRVNGQCLVWSSPDETHYYGTVAVRMNSTPTVRTYAGSDCEGNADTTAKASVSWSSGAGKRTNFRRVTIDWVGGSAS